MQDDDLEWEEWLEMTDVQQDAALDRAITEYNAELAKLTRPELYSYRRRRTLDLCLKWRKIIKQFDLPTFQHYLRKSQKRLLAHRAEYYLGQQVGHA